VKYERTFESFRDSLEQILNLPVHSSDDFRELVNRWTDIEDQIEEELGWRYIRMTLNTENEELMRDYEEYYEGVVARLKPLLHELKKKIVQNERYAPFGFEHMLKVLKNEVELFREENIPLQVEETVLSKEYGAIVGGITVDFMGERKTLQQLSVYLRDPNRSVREAAWRKRFEGIWTKREELNVLFDRLKEIRHRQALNAGFSNYRDYAHRLKGRFEYTPEDLFRFHEAVEKEVVPYLRERLKVRREKLGVESVKPWDTEVDVDGKVLKPFKNVEELVEKTERVLVKIHPTFQERFSLMKEKGLLDLENRKGKAPGGYNHTLPKTGAPFIFMNAVGRPDDVRTIFHELGHAMHSFETLHLPTLYRPERMEVAELASMSMELISMEQWREFYESEEDFKKAKIEELEGTLTFLPWCVIVDAFQHWIYTNPNHTPKERYDYFAHLMDRFNPGVDWTGLEEEKRTRWLFQLHIFEVPFYYIEYGIAQIGALDVYRNYLKDPEKALQDYLRFLRVGCSSPVDEVYRTAGAKLDFSREHLREIVGFVAGEIEKLESSR